MTHKGDEFTINHAAVGRKFRDKTFLQQVYDDCCQELARVNDDCSQGYHLPGAKN